MTRAAMDVCLRVLKHVSTATVSGTLYWSYPILHFGIVECTLFPTTYLEIAVYKNWCCEFAACYDPRAATNSARYEIINALRSVLRALLCEELDLARAKSKALFYAFLSYSENIAHISSGSRGGARPPLILDQIEARRALQKFCLRPPPVPLVWRSGSATAYVSSLSVCTFFTLCVRTSVTIGPIRLKVLWVDD